ncbi:MAG TPA: iron transporter [Anaeromyxobacter sp.]|nr:iron transporter [Anaeromyxobacter sp.]
MKLGRSLVLTLGAVFLGASSAQAAEFYVGEPVEREGLQIVPNYLLGIEMAGMPPGMEMGPGTVHLEADVHATKDEKHGFPEDAWIPYLTIRYTLTKEGGRYQKTGILAPMTAGDGPHYANNVRMGGAGTYHLKYTILPPPAKGFYRHVDRATGVPGWWKPIVVEWTFTYPSKPKG